MKPKSHLRHSLILAASTSLLAISSASAADGTWNANSAGNWSDTAKWTDGNVADGADFSAFLSNVIDAARTITLDSARTIGNIYAQDTGSNYTISGTSTLTLDVTSGVPILGVPSGRTFTISAPVVGNDGLQVQGSGRVTLSSTTTNYSGATTITGSSFLDFVGIANANIGGGPSAGRNITVGSGSVVRFDALSNVRLNRIVETTDTIGVMTGGTTNSFDFSSSTGANLPNAFLGNWSNVSGKAEISGTITPGSSGYKLGARGSNGLLGIVGTNKITGANSLTIGQTTAGTRVELAEANDFTGNTVINTNSKLVLGDNLALQNSALDLGATGGSFALSDGALAQRTTGSSASPSPTFGGLIGSRNLISAFTNTANNNEQLLAASAVTGFTLNVGTGQTHTYSGAIGGFGAGASGGLNGNSTLTKTGLGTQLLSGTNTYTGATNVNAGTLKLGTTGSLANATNVSIAAGATFDLTDKTAASATYIWNTASLGASGAATAATITGTAGGTIDMGATPISLTTDATNPSLTVTGADLTLGGNTFTVVVPGPALTAGVYTLVSAASITGTVNSTASYTGGNGLAGGTTGVVSISGNNVVLTVSASSGTPYDDWATIKGLTGASGSSTDPAKTADPDNDGRNNLAEFAFNGNPLSGADNGKVFVLTEDSDFDVETADKELILTVAVRTGTPAFGGTPPSATQATDNITYSIEGSLDLAAFLTTVNVVPTPVTTDLDAAGDGYEYRSFSLSSSNGLTGKGFLRAKVSTP